MYDVIVVGGGVLGLSTAYYLTKFGAKTLLIDRADDGKATRAGAGIITGETSHRGSERWVDFAIQAAQMYPDFVAELEADTPGATGYARCPFLLVAATEDELEAFDEAQAIIFERQRRRGTPSAADLREITPQEARELFPPLAPVLRALYYGGAARVDGRQLASTLEQVSQRQGLELRQGSVERLSLDGQRVSGVVVDGEMIGAATVIIAGGAWSPALAAPLGLPLPVAPQRGQIAHLRLRGVDTSAWPVVNAFHGHYMVPWPNGRVVAGATRETGAGFEPHLTAKGVAEVIREALRVAPGLADAEILEIRIGLRPLSDDGQPILGPAPGVDGLLLATGHGPMGLTFGPLSGKVIAELALGRSPSADISQFSIARFQA